MTSVPFPTADLDPKQRRRQEYGSEEASLLFWMPIEVPARSFSMSLRALLIWVVMTSTSQTQLGEVQPGRLAQLWRQR